MNSAQNNACAKKVGNEILPMIDHLPQTKLMKSSPADLFAQMDL